MSIIGNIMSSANLRSHARKESLTLLIDKYLGLRMQDQQGRSLPANALDFVLCSTLYLILTKFTTTIL